MENELATKQNNSEIMEQVMMVGDLAKLQPKERIQYYNAVCNSLGLNPLTRPFDYIVLNGKLTLYARKDATEQLRKMHNVSIEKLEHGQVGDLYVATAYARTADGRTDSDMGAVNIAVAKGDSLANAMMKAVTKAKRRVTLSICGLGWLDETEVETIPQAKPVIVNSTGEILDGMPKQLPKTFLEARKFLEDTTNPTAGLVSDLVAGCTELTQQEVLTIINALEMVKAAGKTLLATTQLKPETALRIFDGFVPQESE